MPRVARGIWAAALLALAASRVLAGAPGDDPPVDAIAAAVEREDYAAAIAMLRAKLGGAPDGEGPADETPAGADEPTRFLLARVLAWSGDHDAAIAEYDALLARSPGNVDYSFGRAQALGWANRDEAALEEVARARSLAPDYEDVWRLEHALLRRGSGTGARLRELREQAAQRFPDAEWWREEEPDERLSPADARTEVALGAVQETLSTSAPDWRSHFVRVTRRRNPRSTVYGVVRREERFGRSDAILGGGGDWRVFEKWSAGLDLEVGSGAEFVPKRAITARAGRALPAGWEAQLRLRHRDYGGTQVTSTAATLGRYFADFRLAYTLDRSRLHGQATSAAHALALNYYRSPRTRFNLTAAKGQEVEVIAPGRVLRMDVRAVSLGGRHTLGERLRLSWWVGSHRQGELYRRRYVGISLAAGL